MKHPTKPLRFLLVLVSCALLGAAGGLALVYVRLAPDLPSVATLKEVHLQVPLRVYSRDGKLIGEFGEKRRLPMAFGEIPERVRQAFLAAEDEHFFEHPGVDYQGLARAALHVLLTGEPRQGGSTITMQLARNFFLSREKSMTRKLREILLALRIERELTKPEIFELYLNKIYLGNRAYGVGAAARVYYGRPLQDLDLPQVAMLAGLPKAPSAINPLANPGRALRRRDYVLGRMVALGFITQEERSAAQAAPESAAPHGPGLELEAPHGAEMARAEWVARYGEEAYTRGFQIYTTLDARLQTAANDALRDTLRAYDTRHGYRGALARYELADTQPEQWQAWLAKVPRVAGLTPALVTATQDRTARLYRADGSFLTLEWDGLAWARPYVTEEQRGPAPRQAADVVKPGDLVYLCQEPASPPSQSRWWLAQVPAIEGALVALDPADGAIVALTGGYDFQRSQFNRVTQARRQPGSGFKAFIYSAALEAGFTPASLINDAPLVSEDGLFPDTWRPRNYGGDWLGPTRLRVALYQSRNLVSVRLLRAMGIEHARQHAARFGLDPNRLPDNLTLALGSGEVTPLEMARGYAVLANGGYLIEPYLIERVLDGQGKTLFRARPARAGTDDVPQELDAARPTGEHQHPPAPRTLSPENQYLLVSMLRDVISRGTGRRALALGRADLAGKTGTSNDQRDAWFNGFNRRWVAVVWAGFDSFAPMGNGEVGGRVALPAWINFMRVALRDVPEQDWAMPPAVVTLPIDPATGRRVPAGQATALSEVFHPDHLPEPTPSSAVSSQSSGLERDLVQELF